MMRIIVAAAVVVCMSITAFALPQTRSYILSALQLGAGGSMKADGISYDNYGGKKIYATVDELSSSEGLSFSFPREQSDKYKIEKVLYVEESNTIFLFFKDKTINYEIWLGNTDISIYKSYSTEYHYGKYTTYIFSNDASSQITYYSYTIIGNDIHSIVSTNIEDIEALISSIN